MENKPIPTPFESLGHGLFELAIGIGAIALAASFFKRALGIGKSNQKETTKHE